MRISVTVHGDARVRAGLARSAKQLRTPSPALRDAAKAVTRTAASLAAKRTGRMSRSNKARVSSTRASITNRIRYAWYQEHGTGVMDAHPFLRPAVETTDLTPYFDRYADQVIRDNL